ncbi:MAG: hypothetical protein IKP32_02075, partial [Clostridia bacterium]|nr:hypothetical protein [Clostridia bacterium]
MKKQLRRYIAMLCTVMMLFSSLPTNVIAEEASKLPATETEQYDETGAASEETSGDVAEQPESSKEDGASLADETADDASGEENSQQDTEKAGSEEVDETVDASAEEAGGNDAAEDIGQEAADSQQDDSQAEDEEESSEEPSGDDSQSDAGEQDDGQTQQTAGQPDDTPADQTGEEDEEADASSEEESEQIDEEIDLASLIPEIKPDKEMHLDEEADFDLETPGQLKRVRLTVDKAQNVTLRGTGLPVWVSIKEEITGNQANFTPAVNEETGAEELLVTWNAEKGTYLLTFSANTPGKTGSFHIAFESEKEEAADAGDADEQVPADGDAVLTDDGEEDVYFVTGETTEDTVDEKAALSEASGEDGEGQSDEEGKSEDGEEGEGQSDEEGKSEDGEEGEGQSDEEGKSE